MGRSKFPWILFALFLLLLIGPYLFAGLQSDAQVVFNGFLQNPQDEYSYLAKIEQGKSGSWLFRLPFTSPDVGRKPLFLYYLFLGHIAKILALSPILIFHVSRIVNSVCLFLTFWLTLPTLAATKKLQISWMMTILCFGGGLGWLILPAGKIPGDFWIAESFPFLASFTNPHFPLSIALMVWMVWAWKQTSSIIRYSILAVGALLLAIIQPFANIILGLVFSVDWIWMLVKNWINRSETIALVVFALMALPYMVYSLLIINSDPNFANWNKQNTTPGLTLIDWIFSFSPALILALLYIYGCWKRRSTPPRILFIWAIVTIVLSFIPTQLQRRYLLAASVPLAVLAFQQIDLWMESRPKLGNLARLGWFVFIVPTNLILIAMGILAVTQKNPLLFLYHDELFGFTWLSDHANRSSTVLTGPDTGLYIPAYTSLGVVYGHPFETPNASVRKKEILDCLREGNLHTCERVIVEQGVDYILVGPREQATGWNSPEFMYPVVFESGPLKIYEVD